MCVWPSTLLHFSAECGVVQYVTESVQLACSEISVGKRKNPGHQGAKWYGTVPGRAASPTVRRHFLPGCQPERRPCNNNVPPPLFSGRSEGRGKSELFFKEKRSRCNELYWHFLRCSNNYRPSLLHLSCHNSPLSSNRCSPPVTSVTFWHRFSVTSISFGPFPFLTLVVQC